MKKYIILLIVFLTSSMLVAQDLPITPFAIKNPVTPVTPVDPDNPEPPTPVVPVGNTFSDPIHVGTYSTNFYFDDAKNTTSYTNAYSGTSKNDIFYKFTLSTPMTVVISHCLSAIADTYVSLLNSSGSLIASNDNYSGEGACSRSTNAYLKVTNLAAGTYYVVSEGVSQNGGIETAITGILPPQGDSFSNPIVAGSYNGNFSYTDTKNTTSYSNAYTGKATNDVYYKLTLTAPMNITVSHCGSALADTYMSILNASGTLIYSNDNYTGEGACTSTLSSCIKVSNLAAGTYYIVSEGNTQNGSVTTNIQGVMPPPGDNFASPVTTGTYSGDFIYTDTKNTASYSNAYTGKSTNDVYYKFSITVPMDITLSHCGSALADTYMSVLNTSGTLIYSNDNYTGEGACSSTLNAFIKIKTMAPGTYYVVSEGASQSGSITTTIKGATNYGGLKANDNQNYILKVLPLIETADATKLTAEQSMQSVQYFDGLGRPTQTVQRGITPLKHDLVSLQEYDEFGRESNSWLPAVIQNNSGAYVTPASIMAAAKTTNTNSGTADQNPYSRPVYEASPLNRVLEQYGPGADWQKPTDRKTVRTGYLFNKAKTGVINSLADSLVCALYVSVNTKNTISISKSKNYDANELYVTRMIDEDNNRSYEFKNKQGQVLLTRQINDNQLHDTYYIYDSYGNRRVVLPPIASDKLAANATWTDTNTDLQQLSYLYKFDDYDRCIAKKLPGCDWIYYVYDKADRLVFTQDGEQRSNGKNEWTFFIPDVFGRVVLTGICKNTLNYAANPLADKLVKADWSKTNNACKGYTVSGVSLATPTILTANYYDSYEFIGLNGVPADLAYAALSGYGTQYTTGHSGLPTGNLVAVLDGSANPACLYSAMYYDSRGRIVQTKSTSLLPGGYEKEYIAYNFTGQPTQRQHVHSATGKTTQTEVYKYTYDHAGRLKTTTHQLQEGTATPKPTVVIAENSYDELGRLITSKKAGQANLETTYKYNVRSWTKSISSPLFSQTLYYNESYGGSKAQYNGNISAMDWTVSGDKKRGYAFKYDALSRLTAASYLENGTVPVNTANTTAAPSYKTAYTYDKHGNMKSLQRYGKTTTGSTYGIVDSLIMILTGNQLTKVTDAAANVLMPESNDFKDDTGGNGQYTYNANGAMNKDTHKGILGIRYNSLNLPQELTVKNKSTVGKIYYIYSATGGKLRVNYLASADLSNNPVHGITDQDKLFEINETTDYVGNIIYEKGSLKRILIDGGYIEGGVYYFYLTDHLGNNRVVANATGTPIQKNHYYPFGTPFPETAKEEQAKQPYKYNGKEYQQMHQLNLYDYSARQMDGIRFTSVDPLAEKYYWISPYAYVANNPMKYIDPDGMDIYVIDQNGKTVLAKKQEGNDILATGHRNSKTNAMEIDTNKDGSFKKSISVSDNKLLPQLANNTYELGGGLGNGHYANTSNANDAFNIFKFASDNTSVEWGLSGYKSKQGDKFTLYTSHLGGSAYVANGFEELSMTFNVHSHPNDPEEIGASGYKYSSITGDRKIILTRGERFKGYGRPLPNHFVYNVDQKTLYHYTGKYKANKLFKAVVDPVELKGYIYNQNYNK